jgi:uncharacterized phage infection (PIP) family protein YhgE
MASNDIAGLAGRLTNTQDRETYAALMCFVNDLPPSDEFRRLAELMGLLSVLGQRVPDALAEAMTELRELTTTASDYHAKVDERLANLPREIADGLDVEKMAEAFRQQFSATGLQTSAGLLRDSSREISALSNEICATLAPLSQKYETITAAIDKGITRLTAATEAVQRQNGQLMAEQQSWPRQAVYVMVIFLLGGLCGVVFEKRQTADVLTNVNAQIERIQTPVAPPVAASVPKRTRKGSGS